MKAEQQNQAKHLYFQTNLTKTEIADLLHISRRTLHYWIREGNWDRLKKSATHLPSLLAENCYHIIGHLTKHLLSEYRILRPVTSKEADTLHKLVLTINKLKNRSALNESMEMFAFFLDGLKKKSPTLADEIMPHVDEYLSSRAAIFTQHVQPESFNSMGFLPGESPEPGYNKEEQLDMQDLFDWDNENSPTLDIRAFASLPDGGGEELLERLANDYPAPAPSEALLSS